MRVRRGVPSSGSRPHGWPVIILGAVPSRRHARDGTEILSARQRARACLGRAERPVYQTIRCPCQHGNKPDWQTTFSLAGATSPQDDSRRHRTSHRFQSMSATTQTPGTSPIAPVAHASMNRCGPVAPGMHVTGTKGSQWQRRRTSEALAHGDMERGTTRSSASNYVSTPTSPQTSMHSPSREDNPCRASVAT